MFVKGFEQQRIEYGLVRESTLVAMQTAALSIAVSSGLVAVKKLARKLGMHEHALVVLGTETVEVVLAWLEFFVDGRIVAEGTLVALLTPTFHEEFAQNGLTYRRGLLLLQLLGLLELLFLLLQLVEFAFFLHLFLDGLDRDELR